MTNKGSKKLKQVIQSVAGLLTPSSNRAQPISATLNYKKPAEVSTLSTGFRPLDKALGVGGLPCGKITELIGPGVTAHGGGTTNIAAGMAARAQRQQEVVTIIDLNHSFDPWLAERCGLVAPHLLLARPDTIFAALTLLEQAAAHAGLVIVVLGLVPELLHQVEPQLLTTLLRRLQTITHQASSAFLFVTAAPKNDPFSPANYPPGLPLAELAAIRLWVQDENWTHQGGVSTAYKATLTVIQNRLAIPGKGTVLRIKLNA